MEVLAEIIRAIFAGAGILGVLSFLSVAVNIGLVILIYRAYTYCSASSHCSLQESNIKDALLASKKDLLDSLETMVSSLKKELELVSLTEHQPLREMLIKITASIELLAKTIEYAAKNERAR